MKKLWAALVLILSMAVLLASCDSGSDPIPVNKPTVTTAAVTSITTTTATSGGNVTADGLLGVTARGVCWSKTANPTINDSKTVSGTGKGAFVSAITGLTTNTLYHVRAYATNILGTSYGEDRTFTTKAGFTFTAVQYKILQPDGTTIILRSRGTGSDASKAYFDIFIEDGKGGVEAFLANPVWYHFDAITAENAINHTISDSEVRGLFVGAGGDRDRFFLDINGGSDMGGVTYRIITGAFSIEPSGYLKGRLTGTPIHIDTELGGNIDTGSRAQWNGDYENVNGTVFFNGTIFVTNYTAAHLYFTDLGTGLRLNPHNVTTIGSTEGSQDVQPGYTLTRSVYTYTAEKASGGAWIKDLGTSYPVSFNIEFLDGVGKIQEMRFFPAIVSVEQ